jgi:tetratricopeptide (TPR) repeat protein
MTWKNAKHLTDELEAAARTFDEQGAADLCEKLIERARRDDQPFPFDQAKQALEILRARRMFPLMERLADAFIQSGQAHPRIRRQYAQALLDQGRLSSAVSVLEKLVADTARKDRGENAEARGLLGRAYKQMYCDGHGESQARGGKTLDRAIRYYYDVYHKAPAAFLWHGVNAAALLQRAENDGVHLRGLPRAKVLAEKVLTLAKKADAKTRPGDPSLRWNSATALEAAIGLGRYDEVHGWLERYLRSDGLTAFELASTHRQLKEVWQLTPREGIGAEVFPLIEAKLLRCSGAGLEVTPAHVSARTDTLERVLGDTTYVNVNWYRRGLERCARVARVETELDPDLGFGTGFLVRGSDLKDSLGGDTFLVTNAHVVSAQGVKDALRPEQARISFKASPAAEGKRWNVKAVRRESPPDMLDFAILELDSPVDPSAAPYPVAKTRPQLDEGARVYIIGHPKGGTLSLSLNDNRLLDYDDRLLHYRAPTEGGSSGSPVFNQDWELLGLHHSGGKDMAKLNGKEGRYAANEGIWIEALRKGID